MEVHEVEILHVPPVAAGVKFKIHLNLQISLQFLQFMVQSLDLECFKL